MNKYFRIFAPYCKSLTKCMIRKINININGINAGYARMLSHKFPFNSSIIALCIPQPGHSYPVNW